MTTGWLLLVIAVAYAFGWGRSWFATTGRVAHLTVRLHRLRERLRREGQRNETLERDNRELLSMLERQRDLTDALRETLRVNAGLPPSEGAQPGAYDLGVLNRLVEGDES